MAKSKISNEEKLLMLNNTLKNDVNNFLSFYSRRDNYLAQVLKVIATLGINDLKDLTYESYITYATYKQKPIDNMTSAEKYTESFFRWVYCFIDLHNAIGFEKVWKKGKEKSDFLKRKLEDSNKNICRKEEMNISIEDLQKINEYVNLDYDDDKFLSHSFAWDLLFNTDYLDDNAIQDIKRIDASTYDGAFIIVNGIKVVVKEKYKPLFENLKKRSSNNGMIIYTALKKLSDNVGIENSLTPKDIKKIRKAYMFTCPNCNMQYPNNTENWISVNKVIVCKDCAERLKKNKSFRIEDINNNEIDYLSDEEKEDIETKFSSFEQLRAKIGNEKDYIQLQKFKDKLGKLGEAYVYDYEIEYLKDTPYAEKVDKTIAYNDSNGYDILSYTKQGEEIHIEVKCTVNKEDCFYLTSHEKSIMEESFKQNTKYMIYWVKNILSENKESIKLIKYGEKEIKEYLKLEPHTYKAKDNR